MSDEEEDDQEYFLEPWRDSVVREDAIQNFDILKEKTINFEDLLNELVQHGGLSFEEKFKILSGIVDETTTNKTIPEKCNELYQTILIRRKVPMTKVLHCWVESGNNYLVGRFDTHFSLEGRDSKSLKFHKFKAIPSHRIDYLTHIHLKQLTLSPRALLKCLRKSNRLVSIRLERIKVPHGGRESDDPSTDFDQPLILPNLKEFYFEEVSKHEPFKSIKEVNCFLDELNLKPMLFFGLNPAMAWDAGIKIEVRMRGATLLKMQTKEEDGEAPHFISMIRRRPADYGGFTNPENCPKVALYECYLPKNKFAEGVSQLFIYRCKVSNFDPLLASCPNLERVTLYGECETGTVPQIDLNCFAASRTSLKYLSFGYVSIFFSNFWDKDCTLSLNLEQLTLDTVLIKVEGADLQKLFKSVKKLQIISTSAKNLVNLVNTKIVRDEIKVADFNWTISSEGEEEKENEEKEKIQPFVSFLTENLKPEKDFSFSLTPPTIEEEREDEEELKPLDSWKVQAGKYDIGEMTFEWSPFISTKDRATWFDLPYKVGEDGKGENPRAAFRTANGF